jgi:hypothetical protein
MIGTDAGQLKAPYRFQLCAGTRSERLPRSWTRTG